MFRAANLSRLRKLARGVGAPVTLALAPEATTAEAIKIGTLKIAAYGLLFIAVDKSYFAANVQR